MSGRARELLQVVVETHLHGLDGFTDDQVRTASRQLAAKAHAAELRELARAVEGPGLPWTPSSAAALRIGRAAIEASDQEAVIHTPCGPVDPAAELERLQEEAEKVSRGDWNAATLRETVGELEGMHREEADDGR